MDEQFDYWPEPTLAKFHASDARVRAVRGPVGSGKSTAMAMELFRRAAEQKPGKDGIRRSRAVITRNTLQQLRSTCLVTIEQILRPVMRFKVSESTIQIRAGDIHSDWLLLPLDTPENIQRLLSLELTFAWMSEFREMDVEIAMSVMSRCGRFPSPAFGGPTWHGLILESNSFTEDSQWFDKLELDRPGNWDYFVQPGAREPDAEGLQFLPPDYYTDMVESNSPEWVDQYVDNKIGPSLSGQAVYKNTFIKDFHVADTTLRPIAGHPLIVGCDFARWPAAVICQFDHRGRLLVFKELEMENTGVEQFVTKKLLPALSQSRFRGMSSYIVGDPSGRQRSQIGEESVFDMLRRLNFTAVPATTNNIDPRIRAVEKFLLGQTDGGALMLIDGEHCPLLVQGFLSLYRYKKKKDGSMDIKPDKNNRPFPDLHDALQYACLGTASNLRGRVMNHFNRANNANVVRPPPAAGWT